MEIELGDEYAQAAKENMAKAISASKRDGRAVFAIIAFILMAWIAFAYRSELPDGLMISVTIVISTMCLVGVVNFMKTVLEAGIIYNSGAIEWFGQNHLDRWDAKHKNPAPHSVDTHP